MPMYGQKKATIKGTASTAPAKKPAPSLKTNANMAKMNKSKPTIKEPGVKKMGTSKDLLSGIKKKTK